MARLDYDKAMEVAAFLAAGIAAGNVDMPAQAIVRRATEVLCLLEAAVQEKFPEDAIEPVAS